MKGAEIQSGERPVRVLVVDDEACIRHLNIRMLLGAGYQADGAENGAVAWETLQVTAYDLLITDHSMPKVTGLELIEKVRGARMALPVIIATGASPYPKFKPDPQRQPAAMLLKPYTLTEFLGTVKKVLGASIAGLILLLCLAPASRADDTQPSAQRPDAGVISTKGMCEYSADGSTFTNLDRGNFLEQGAVIRTGENGRTDLFFRRTGTVVRLQAGTEIKLEKMTLTLKDGLPVVHTLLDLRKGRIFTVVRSRVPGSILEIRNAAGRSVVEGSGIGRYIITADGTHVSAIGSVIPLKVIGENGITILSAGQQFDRHDGKMIPVATDFWVQNLIQLDELQAISETPDPTQPALKP